MARASSSRPIVWSHRARRRPVLGVVVGQLREVRPDLLVHRLRLEVGLDVGRLHDGVPVAGADQVLVAQLDDDTLHEPTVGQFEDVGRRRSGRGRQDGAQGKNQGGDGEECAHGRGTPNGTISGNVISANAPERKPPSAVRLLVWCARFSDEHPEGWGRLRGRRDRGNRLPIRSAPWMGSGRPMRRATRGLATRGRRSGLIAPSPGCRVCRCQGTRDPAH